MYLKILGAFLVITASTGMGCYFGNRVRDRLIKLKMLRQQFSVIREDIAYSGTTLPEAMQAMGERLSQSGECEEMEKFYKEVSARLLAREGLPFQKVWQEAVEHHLGKTTLERDDLELLSSLGGQFGYLDRQMQLKTIDLYLMRLEEEALSQQQKAGEKMHLYRTLGILAGVFLVVVML